uniref:Uncharacterized protein n=1 Tax=Anopheles farauti TaxID=69004 RepID=A0A182QF88_9DIPT
MTAAVAAAAAYSEATTTGGTNCVLDTTSTPSSGTQDNFPDKLPGGGVWYMPSGCQSVPSNNEPPPLGSSSSSKVITHSCTNISPSIVDQSGRYYHSQGGPHELTHHPSGQHHQFGSINRGLLDHHRSPLSYDGGSVELGFGGLTIEEPSSFEDL